MKIIANINGLQNRPDKLDYNFFNYLKNTSNLDLIIL